MCSKPNLLTNILKRGNSCKSELDETSEKSSKECISNKKEEDISNELFDKHCLDKEETPVNVSVEKPNFINSFVYTKSENPRSKHWFKTYSGRKKTDAVIKESPPPNISTDQNQQEFFLNAEATIIHKNDIQHCNNVNIVQLSDKLPLSNRRVKIVFPANFVNKPKILDTKGNLITKPPSVLCAEINLLKDFPSMLPPLSSKLNIVSSSHISESINVPKELNTPIKDPIVSDKHLNKRNRQERLKTDLCTKSVCVDVHHEVPNKTSDKPPGCSSSVLTNIRKDDVSFKVKPEENSFIQSKNNIKRTFNTKDPLLERSEALRPIDSSITNRLQQQVKNNVIENAKNIDVLANPKLPEIQLPIKIEKSEALTIHFNDRTQGSKHEFLENPKRHDEKNEKKSVNECEVKSHSIKNITDQLKTEMSNNIDQLIIQSQDSKLQTELSTTKRGEIPNSGENSKLKNVSVKETTIAKYSKMKGEPLYEELEKNNNSKKEVLQFKQPSEKDINNEKNLEKLKGNGKLKVKITEKSTEKPHQHNQTVTSFCLSNQERFNNQLNLISEVKSLGKNDFIVEEAVPKKDVTSSIEIKPCKNIYLDISPEKSQLVSVKNLDQKNTELAQIECLPYVVINHESTNECKVETLKINLENSKKIELKSKNKDDPELICHIKSPEKMFENKPENKYNMKRSESVKTSESLSTDYSLKYIDENVSTKKQHTHQEQKRTNTEIEVKNMIEESSCKQNETGITTILKNNNLRRKISNSNDNSETMHDLVEFGYGEENKHLDLLNRESENNQYFDASKFQDLNEEKTISCSSLTENQQNEPENVSCICTNDGISQAKVTTLDIKEENTCTKTSCFENEKLDCHGVKENLNCKIKHSNKSKIVTDKTRIPNITENTRTSGSQSLKIHQTANFPETTCIKYTTEVHSEEKSSSSDCFELQSILEENDMSLVNEKEKMENQISPTRNKVCSIELSKQYIKTSDIPETVNETANQTMHRESKNKSKQNRDVNLSTQISESIDAIQKFLDENTPINKKSLLNVSTKKSKASVATKTAEEKTKKHEHVENKYLNKSYHDGSNKLVEKDEFTSISSRDSEIKRDRKCKDTIVGKRKSTSKSSYNQDIEKTAYSSNIFNDSLRETSSTAKTIDIPESIETHVSSKQLKVPTKLTISSKHLEGLNEIKDGLKLMKIPENITKTNFVSRNSTKSKMSLKNLIKTNTSEILPETISCSEIDENTNEKYDKVFKKSVNSVNNPESPWISKNITQTKIKTDKNLEVLTSSVDPESVTKTKLSSKNKLEIKKNPKNTKEISASLRNVSNTNVDSEIFTKSNITNRNIRGTNTNSEKYKELFLKSHDITNDSMCSENIKDSINRCENISKNSELFEIFSHLNTPENIKAETNTSLENVTGTGTSIKRITNDEINIMSGIAAVSERSTENIIAESNTTLKNVTETGTSHEPEITDKLNITSNTVAITKSSPKKRIAETNQRLENVTKTGTSHELRTNDKLNITSESVAVSENLLDNRTAEKNTRLNNVTETSTCIENMTNNESNIMSGIVLACSKKSPENIIAETIPSLDNVTETSTNHKPRTNYKNIISNIVAVPENPLENRKGERNPSLENVIETGTSHEPRIDVMLNITSNIVAISENSLEIVFPETNTSLEKARVSGTIIENLSNDDQNITSCSVPVSKNSRENMISETNTSLENASITGTSIENMTNNELNITSSIVAVPKNSTEKIKSETNTILENLTENGTSHEPRINDTLNITSDIVAVSENSPEILFAETNTSLEKARVSGTIIENLSNDDQNITSCIVPVSKNSRENMISETNTSLENASVTGTSIENMTNNELNITSSIVAVPKKSTENIKSETNTILENLTENGTSHEPKINDTLNITSDIVAVSENSPEIVFPETNTSLEKARVSGTIIENLRVNVQNTSIVPFSENSSEIVIAETNTSLDATVPKTCIENLTNDDQSITSGIVVLENSPENIVTETNTSLKNSIVAGTTIEKFNISSGIFGVSKNSQENIKAKTNTSLEIVTETDTSLENMTKDELNLMSDIVAISKNSSENRIAETRPSLENVTETGTNQGPRTNDELNITSDLLAVPEKVPDNRIAQTNTSLENVTKTDTSHEPKINVNSVAISKISSENRIAGTNLSLKNVTEIDTNHEPRTNNELNITSDFVAVSEKNPNSRITQTNTSLENFTETATSHGPRSNDTLNFAFDIVAVSQNSPQNRIAETTTSLENVTETGTIYEPRTIPENDVEYCITSSIVVVSKKPLENIIAGINTGIDNCNKTGSSREIVTVLKSNGTSSVSGSENHLQDDIDFLNTNFETVRETGIIDINSTTLENNTRPNSVSMPENNSKFFFGSCDVAVFRNPSENVITDGNTNLIYKSTSGMVIVSKNSSENVKFVIKASLDNVMAISTIDETRTIPKKYAKDIISSGSEEINRPECIIADAHISEEKVTETNILIPENNSLSSTIPVSINPSGDIIIDETTTPENVLEFHKSDETVIIPKNNPATINRSVSVDCFTNISENIICDLNKSVENIIENSISHETVTKTGKYSEYFRSDNIAVSNNSSKDIISDKNTKLEKVTESCGKKMKIPENNAQSNITTIIVNAPKNTLENRSKDIKKFESTDSTKIVNELTNTSGFANILQCASENHLKKIVGCESKTILEIEENETKVKKIQVLPNSSGSQIIKKRLCPKSKKYRLISEIEDKRKGFMKAVCNPYKHSVISENANEGNTSVENITNVNVQEHVMIPKKKLCPKSKKFFSTFCKNRYEKKSCLETASNLRSPSNIHIIINESDSKAKNLQKSSDLDSSSNIPKDTLIEISVNSTEDLLVPDVAIIPKSTIKANNSPENPMESPTISETKTNPKMLTDIIFDSNNVVGANLISPNFVKCNDIQNSLNEYKKLPETISQKSQLLNDNKSISEVYNDIKVPEVSNTKCSFVENTLPPKKYLEMYHIQDCFVNLDEIQIEGNSITGENLEFFLKNNTLVVENSFSNKISAMSLTNQKVCCKTEDIITVDQIPERMPDCNKFIEKEEIYPPNPLNEDNDFFTIINLRNKKYVIKRLNFTSQSDNSDDGYSLCSDRGPSIECDSEGKYIGIGSNDENTNILDMKSVRVMLEPIDHILHQENSIKLNESILQKLYSKDVPEPFYNKSQAYGEKCLEFPQSQLHIKLSDENNCITPIENIFHQDNESLNEEKKVFDSQLPIVQMGPKSIKRKLKNDATVNQSSKVKPNNPHIIQMPEELEEKQRARNKQIELLLNTNGNAHIKRKLFPKSKKTSVSKNKFITSCPENSDDLQIIYEGVGNSTLYQNKPTLDCYISQNQEKIIKSEFGSSNNMHDIVPKVVKPQSESKNNNQGKDIVEEFSPSIHRNISKQCIQKNLHGQLTNKYLNAPVNTPKTLLDTKTNIKVIEYTSKMDKISNKQISVMPTVHKGSTSIVNNFENEFLKYVQNTPAPTPRIHSNCTTNSNEKTAAVKQVLSKTKSPSKIMYSETSINKLNYKNQSKNVKKNIVSKSNLAIKCTQPKKVTLEYLNTAKKSFVMDKEPTFISHIDSVSSKSKTNIFRKSSKNGTQLFRSKTMDVTSEKYPNCPKNILGIKEKCITELSNCSITTTCNTSKLETEKITDQRKSNSEVNMEYETDLTSSSITNASTKTLCNSKIQTNVEKITVENQKKSNSEISEKKLVLSSTLEKETLSVTKYNTSTSYSFNSVDDNLKNSYPTAQSNLLDFQNSPHNNIPVYSNESNSDKRTLNDHCPTFADNFSTSLKCTSSLQNICPTLDPTMQLDINVPILPETFSYEETVLEDFFPDNDLCYNTQPFLQNNLTNSQFVLQGASIQSNPSVTIANSVVPYIDSDNCKSTPINTMPNQRTDTFSSRNNKSDQPTSSTSLSELIFTRESNINFSESNNSLMNTDISSSFLTPCPSPSSVTFNPCGSSLNTLTSSCSRPIKYTVPHLSSSPHLFIPASNSISIPSIVSEIGSLKSSVISAEISPVSHETTPPVSFHNVESNNFNFCENNSQIYEFSKEDIGKTTVSFETNTISSDIESGNTSKSLCTDQNTAKSPRKPGKRKSTCTLFETYDAVIESVVAKYSNEFHTPVEIKTFTELYKNINEVQSKPLPPIQSLNSQLPIFQLSNSSCIHPGNTSEIFLSDSSFNAESTSPNASIVHNSNQSDVICNFSPYSSDPSIMNPDESSCNQTPTSNKLEEQSLIEENYVGAEFQALTEWLLKEYLEIPKDSEACHSSDNLEVNKTASIERISSQLEASCEANNESNLILSLPSTSLQNCVPASIDTLRSKSPTPSYQQDVKNNSSEPTKSTSCFDEASKINHIYEVLQSKSKQNAAWNQLNPCILKVKSVQFNIRAHRRLSHNLQNLNSSVESSFNISPCDSLQHLKQGGKRKSEEKPTDEHKKQKVDIPSTTASNQRINEIVAQLSQEVKTEDTNVINNNQISTPQPLKQKKQISREKNTFKQQNTKNQHTAITHLTNHIDNIVTQISQEVKSEETNRKINIDPASFEISGDNEVTNILGSTNHSLKQQKQKTQGKITMEYENLKADVTSSDLNKHIHKIIAQVSQKVKTKETNRTINNDMRNENEPVIISKTSDPVQSEQSFIKEDEIETTKEEICGDKEKNVLKNDLSKVKCCLLQRENKQPCLDNTEENHSKPHLTLTLVPSKAVTYPNSSKAIPPQTKPVITEKKREHKIIPISSDYKMDHKYENKKGTKEKKNDISSIIEQQLQTVKKFCLEKSWRNHVSPLGNKVENEEQTKKNKVFQTGDFCIKNHDLFKLCPPIWRLDVERKKIDEYVHTSLDEGSNDGFNFMFKQNSSIGNFLSEDTNLWIKIYFSVGETSMKFDQLKNEEVLEKFVLERSLKGSVSFKPSFIFYIQVIISQAMNSDFIPYILRSPKDNGHFYLPWTEINNILNRYMKTINLCFILYDEHIIESLIQYPSCALIEDEHNSIQENHTCPLCGSSICNVKMVLTGAFYDRKNLMSLDNEQDKKETYLCKECSELSVLFSKVVHFNYSVYQLALKHIKAQSTSNMKNDVNSVEEKQYSKFNPNKCNIDDSASDMDTKTFEKKTVATSDNIDLKKSLLDDSQFYSHLFSYFQSILAHIDYCEYFHLCGPFIFRRRIKNRYDDFIVDVCYGEDEDTLRKTKES